MTEKYLQIKIEISEIKPLIWRRLVVPTNMTFKQLHWIIQFSFDWTNSHLYEFNIGNYTITNDEYYDYPGKEIMADTAQIGLSLIEGEEFTYIYDFGDFWNHKIIVEKVIEAPVEIKEPHCIAGLRRGPLEDCGGIHGYARMQKILSNKTNPEYAEMIEWAGDDYDPEFFDIDYINQILSNLDDEISEYESIWDLD